MTCLICRYFQPTEPPEHKAEREAGKCQSFCGREWDQHTAIRYVQNHGSIQGWCRLQPEPRRCGYNHVCGSISVREYFYNPHWAVERFQPNDNLFEWASNALTTVLGGGNPRYQDRRRLVDENKELRRQLKRAREISASRLERLQKTNNEPEHKQEPEQASTPVYPRLVAAE